MNSSPLLEQKEMSNPLRTPSWLLDEYRTFHEIVTKDDFPCVFGLAAEKDGELRYTFVEGDDLVPLPAALEAFLRLSRSRPQVKHNLTVFFRPEAEEKPFEYYRNRFWRVLNFLHARD